MASNKFLAFLFIFLLAAANLTFAAGKDYTQQRELFLRVEKDLKRGNKKAFKDFSPLLKSYPLYPYLEYTLLERNIKNTSLKELNSFSDKYQNIPVVNKLRNKWLMFQAEHNNWKNYMQAYVNSEDTELQCYYLWAHYKTKNSNQIFKYVPSLWLTSESQPKACDPIFAAWEHEGLMTRAMIWQRIKLAVQNKTPRLAKYLAKKLEPQESKLVDLWINVDNNPKLISKKYYFTSKHPAVSEILVHGISKLSNQNPNLAIQLWRKIAENHEFTQKHWLIVVKAIGIALAKEQHPDADKWLAKVPANLLNQSVADARLRYAIQHKKWKMILTLAESLAEELKQDEKWLYWKARALDRNKQPELSQQILSELAVKRSYYGFLASLHLVKPFSFKNVPTVIHESDLTAIKQKPAIKRAYELQKINYPALANTEWRHALKNMSDKEKEAAAILAAKWKNPNWAIVALANANSKNDLALRFPKSYSQYIHREAKVNKLDPALIFAIARQESAFVPDARSPAGALGLMQLMPHTGKMLAKQHQIKIRSHYDLLDEEKNIHLGSKYFRMMLDKYKQNPVLAAAAYNAGPQRIKQWLPEKDMAADSWIESIPYKETRNYVQNILTYTVIYQQLLNKRPILHAHMPNIPGKNKFQTTTTKGVS